MSLRHPAVGLVLKATSCVLVVAFAAPCAEGCVRSSLVTRPVLCTCPLSAHALILRCPKNQISILPSACNITRFVMQRTHMAYLQAMPPSSHEWAGCEICTRECPTSGSGSAGVGDLFLISNDA